MKRIAPTMLSLALLSGCATQAMQVMQSNQSSLEAAHSAYLTCSAPIESDPQYAPLAAHMPAVSDHPMYPQMADASYASPADAALVESLFNRLDNCDQTFANQLELVSQDAGDAYSDGYESRDLEAADLARRKITWGQFNTENDAIMNRSSEQVGQALGDMNSELAEENQQQRQARAQAWANISAALAASAPVTTSCTSVGYSTTCTSY